MEGIAIRYRTEDPIAGKRDDHAHSIKIRIQEMLASFGNFFIAMYTNEDTQRLTFAQISKLKVDCMISKTEFMFTLHTSQSARNRLVISRTAGFLVPTVFKNSYVVLFRWDF